jgi:outer membrane protein assembly factor BamD
MIMSGCASVLEYGYSLWDSIFGEEEEKTPQELIEEGRSKLQRGKYEEAVELFQMLKDRYPYSKYAIEAELRLADALYYRGEYDSAFDAYDEFEMLHPKNSEIPYVIYQKGMCHFKQISTIDRDQTHTLKASEEFRRLIKRFPRHKYAHMARKNLRKCLIYLAEYELYVGKFYYKKGKYQAAIDRFSYIIKNYPDMGQYNQALEYIRKCKEKLNKRAQ